MEAQHAGHLSRARGVFAAEWPVTCSTLESVGDAKRCYVRSLESVWRRGSALMRQDATQGALAWGTAGEVHDHQGIPRPSRAVGMLNTVASCSQNGTDVSRQSWIKIDDVRGATGGRQ